MLIERRQCTNKECRKTHRLLPGYKVFPYKHYDASLIEEVVEGTADEESLLETQYPSESTLERWREWADKLIRNAEGQLRSMAYRVYDLSYEFLKAERSLLEELKKRIDERWMTTVVRIYIDTGGG